MNEIIIRSPTSDEWIPSGQYNTPVGYTLDGSNYLINPETGGYVYSNTRLSFTITSDASDFPTWAVGLDPISPIARDSSLIVGPNFWGNTMLVGAASFTNPYWGGTDTLAGAWDDSVGLVDRFHAGSSFVLEIQTGSAVWTAYANNPSNTLTKTTSVSGPLNYRVISMGVSGVSFTQITGSAILYNPREARIRPTAGIGSHAVVHP